jgi:hypothetical protein
MLPGYFVFPSLTQKAADENRCSPKPPAAMRALVRLGDAQDLSSRQTARARSGTHGARVLPGIGLPIAQR